MTDTLKEIKEYLKSDIILHEPISLIVENKQLIKWLQWCVEYIEHQKDSHSDLQVTARTMDAGLLELKQENQKLSRQIDCLNSRLRILREALEFYGDVNTYRAHRKNYRQCYTLGKIFNDCGELARQALGEE